MTRPTSIENLDDKTRVNAWWDNMIGNNSVVSERKENFRLSQPDHSIFWRRFVSRCRGNKQLVNHFVMNVSEVVVVCKRPGIQISSQCKRLRIRILQKIDNSGNIYESGKISSSVNLVLVFGNAHFPVYKTPSTHIRIFWMILNLLFPNTASVHRYPANSTANPDIFKSALQSEK